MKALAVLLGVTFLVASIPTLADEIAPGVKRYAEKNEYGYNVAKSEKPVVLEGYCENGTAQTRLTGIVTDAANNEIPISEYTGSVISFSQIIPPNLPWKITYQNVGNGSCHIWYFPL
jgi:hypothetical protein